MMLLKPIKAQRLLRLTLENVRRYRAGELSYAAFFYRANKLWLMIQHSGYDEQVTKAYLEALGW